MRSASLILAVVLGSVSVALAQPDPVVSEYFKTKGGGTATEPKDGVVFAYFGIILEPLKPLPENAVLVAEFENPQYPAKPYVTEHVPGADEKKIVIRSEKFTCVVNNRDYRISVKLYSAADRASLLGEHVQPINFRMPKKYLQQLGLKECAS
jgi:hypothetical protein